MKDYCKPSFSKLFVLANVATSFIRMHLNKFLSLSLSNSIENILDKMPANFSNLIKSFTKHEPMIWHEISPEMIALQAEALGIPLVQIRTTWGSFEDQVRMELRKLKSMDIRGVVWGIAPPGSPDFTNSKALRDYLQLNAEKDWIDRICKDEGIKPITPLWSKKPHEVLLTLIKENFKAIITVLNPQYFNEEWLGKVVDYSFLQGVCEIHKNKGIHIGGDDYHTFVIDGPIFKKRIRIVKSIKVFRHGYYLLDILKAKLEPK